MMKKVPKVVIYTNIIAPYTTIGFNYLNNALEGNFLVIYQNFIEDNRRSPSLRNTIGYEYKVLNSSMIAIRGADTLYFALKDTLMETLSKEDFDIFISAGWNSLSTFLAQRYCHKKRKKFVLWSGSTIYERSIFRTISMPFVRNLVRKSDAYIAYGTRAKEYIIELGADPEKIALGWNCIDNMHFANSWNQKTVEELKERYNIKDKRVILFNGRFTKMKGLYELLKAYKNLKNRDDRFVLFLIGYGKEENNLKREAEKERIRDVIFAGFVSYEEMPNYYRLGDVLVLPSKKEVWGLVVNEAMACGLPVVVSRKCGCSIDLVEPGYNGEILDSLCSWEMVEKISRSYENREEYGVHSQQRIKNYSVESRTNNVLEILH